ncbi:YncE family protein [Staphylococcus felis]|uniref:YncE family protein n=1 Tax=Staphylococcus felis TaxID=46127 RepID=UPI0039672FA5
MKEKFIYVTNTDSNDISVISSNKNSELTRIPVGGSPRGSMALHKNLPYGYVCNCAGDTISKIDLTNNKEDSKIKVGLAPRGVCVDPNRELIYVSNSGSSDVSIVSTENDKEILRINVGENPRFLSVSPDGKYLSVPCSGSDNIYIIELTDNVLYSKISSIVELGEYAKPYHAFTHKNYNIYTANTHRHSVSVIDLYKKTVTTEIPVGYGPRAVIADPHKDLIYVSCEASNSVSVIDINKNEEIKHIDVGPTPRGLKIDEKSEILYVSAFKRTMLSKYNQDGDGLSVVDLKTLERKGYIKTGLGPCSVSIYEPNSEMLVNTYEITNSTMV